MLCIDFRIVLHGAAKYNSNDKIRIAIAPYGHPAGFHHQLKVFP
jgi:hypothetical protein